MTRFTAIALACLLSLSAKANDCPVLTLYAQFNADGACLSLRCHATRLIRDAVRRGELKSVHLATASECNELSRADLMTGDRLQVPCTYDVNDYYRPHAQ